jgi:uncharacterized protein YyaL (SSP411 family)
MNASLFARRLILPCALLLAAASGRSQATPSAAPIAWQPWSDAVFAQAKSSHRYVLMDLEAVWCHWCHVMDETTYRDAGVANLIGTHFIPVKVDQDARPDISRRFEMYGWPATILFDADGNVIAHYRGYHDPEVFAHLLHAVLADPSPLHSEEEEDRSHPFAAHALLAESVRAEVERRYRASLDVEHGGLLQGQKFLDRDATEYGLWLSEHGDAAARAATRKSLDAARALIDPAWGGMYQYSTDGDWVHPHFEKIAAVQANALRLYSLAYQEFKDPADLASARAIHGYLVAFLRSPDGAFYTSQDADLVPGEHSAQYFALNDAQRRAQGVPRIDTHVYARENGWIIEALAQYYSASGDASALSEARQAAAWIAANRLAHDGLYRHEKSDDRVAYLGDSLAMARAHLALYTVTADAHELAQARALAARFSRFGATLGVGYVPVPESAGGSEKLLASPSIDENIDMARFGNLLSRYSGDKRDQLIATRALRYLDTERIALRFGTVPGILLANAEAGVEPLHITIVGAHDDALAAALFRDALAQPAVYRRIEWWDPSGAPLAHSDVKFPVLGRATAFVCTQSYCSRPLFDGVALAEQVAASTLAH